VAGFIFLRVLLEPLRTDIVALKQLVKVRAIALGQQGNVPHPLGQGGQLDQKLMAGLFTQTAGSLWRRLAYA
jgi:hypothetical protein